MHYHRETHISEVNLFLFSFGGGTTIISFIMFFSGFRLSELIGRMVAS